MNELTHYGIEGMKWGVRRYQNPDGSLTAAGKERYYQAKDNYKLAKTIVKKGVTVRDPKTGELVDVKGGPELLSSEKRKLKSAKDLYKRAKKADKGLKLYEKGKTITSNEAKIRRRNKVIKALTLASTTALAASAYSRNNGIGREYLNKMIHLGKLNVSMETAMLSGLLGTTAATSVTSFVKNVHNDRQNEKMRAYWHRNNDVKALQKNKTPNYGG